MPVIPTTQEAEAGELPEPGDGGCGEPRSCHCTLAWVTSKTPSQKNKKERKKIGLMMKTDWETNVLILTYMLLFFLQVGIFRVLY